MLPEFFGFHNPTKVLYQVGIAQDFNHELDLMGADNYFIVSDKVISDIGLVKKVTDGLDGVKISGEYLDVPQDAELQSVKELAERAKAAGAGGLIAVGGGSVIDAAKGANILLSLGGDLVEDYSGAHTLPEQPLKPLVVIPTTSGTGSEVTMIAVIYDKENLTKSPFTDKHLLPDLALIDPEMTITMPPQITASTGMDALTHAVEACLSLEWSPVSTALASKAIELIFENAEQATKDGENLDARGAMCIASCLAGIAFTHSMVGVVHGMAHTVGGLYHVPHGVANGILLPHGMEYNFDEVTDKLAKLAHFMGENISGLSEEEAARKSIEGVRKLTKKLNALDALPLRLGDVGVPEDGLPAVAEGTTMDGTSFYNPCEVEEEKVLKHLKNAF